MEQNVGTPPQALFDAIDKYIGEQEAAGHFVDGGGLFGTADAVNFISSAGVVRRIDGPYAEAKEVVGGWALVRVRQLRSARRASASEGSKGGSANSAFRLTKQADGVPSLQRPSMRVTS